MARTKEGLIGFISRRLMDNQGEYQGSKNGVRFGDKSFAERHSDQVLVVDPFDWVNNTVRAFQPADVDPGHPIL